jgi:beta-ribofuranosylaminobenzene 5'-phosphate synthase
VINEKASKLFKLFHINNKNFHFNLLRYYPSHVGLGSKTQLSLAIGTAISKLKNMDIPIEEITKMVERGGTSGIGWRGFETGGFIVDGGHDYGIGKEKENFLPSSASGSANPALTISKYNIPENWRFVLVIPNVKPGAFGEEEVDIFKKYTPIPRDEVNEVSHQILMKMLPGILRNDLQCFGEGLKRIQSIGFKKIEISLQKQIVKDLLKLFEKIGVKAYGMSSFGPSILGITDSDEEAEKLKETVEKHLNGIGGHIFLCRPNNTGAKIEYIE